MRRYCLYKGIPGAMRQTTFRDRDPADAPEAEQEEVGMSEQLRCKDCRYFVSDAPGRGKGICIDWETRKARKKVKASQFACKEIEKR